MTSRSLGHRAPLLWLVLPYMAGIVLGRAAPWLAPAAGLAAAALAAGFAACAAWRQRRGALVAAAVAAFFAGAANCALHLRRLPDGTRPPREAALTLRVDRVFPRAPGKGTAGLATVAASKDPRLIGQPVYFSARLAPDEDPPIRSAVIACSGVLSSVSSSAAAGSFDGYLADAGMNFRLERGRVLREEARPSRYNVFLDSSAAKLNAWLSAGIEAKRPELAAVYRAMMLGQKHELTPEQKSEFMQSGTMHLFAINGIHIGVVAVSLHALLALLRCPRPAAALITLAVLWFDVDTTGASPSAVRAFILVACGESALVLRRPINGLAALSAAAAIVLVLNPLSLFSASFQMSYGVVLAILCFGLPLADSLQERFAPFAHLPRVTWSRAQRAWAGVLRWFWPAFGIGAAAGLVSAITGPEFFRTFAPVGLLSNLALIPAAMMVIVAGFIAIVASAVGAGFAAVVFNHAALLLLFGIEAAIRMAAALPGAWCAAEWRASWAPGAALGLVLGTVLAGYATGWQSRAMRWAPCAAAAVAAGLGVRFGGAS